MIKILKIIAAASSLDAVPCGISFPCEPVITPVPTAQFIPHFAKFEILLLSLNLEKSAVTFYMFLYIHCIDLTLLLIVL